jgi:16S rRNA (adenine1518-N6/adenine1519-N6)-dimethyltransferase
MAETPQERSTIAELKGTLREHNLRARKSLGQHFLVDRGILRTIARAAELTAEDTVIEVGPGTGLLTSELHTLAGEVIAVELDRQMVALLRESYPADGNVRVVEGDILTLPPAQLLAEHSLRHPGRYKVVANLPYYITSPVLRHFLHAGLPPSLMVVMVQQEVGRAIAAQPGDMSVLSVIVQAFARPSVVRKVSARSFHPAPKVDSLVLRLDAVESPPIAPSEVSEFLDFVGAGFHSPRKQLRNSFGHGLVATRPFVDDLLARGGIEPTRRPETLTVEEWVRLWHIHRQMAREATTEC